MASITLQPRAFYFWSSIENQIKTKPRAPPVSPSFAGQTAIVTGSNIGIGLECARIMLVHNLSHVILAVRSVEKGEKAAQLLRRAHPKAKVDVWALDMLSYDSIQAFAKRCGSLLRLDIVILNAAFGGMSFSINACTGHEAIFQVNYLSTALLSILLLPILKEKRASGAPGRMAIVSSGLALQASFKNRNIDPLIPSFDDGKDWGMMSAANRYNDTKTMVLMLVLKLSQAVGAEDVVVTAVDPGYTKSTGLDREAPGFAKAMLMPLKLVARTPEQAAWTYIDAITADGRVSHGSFLLNWKIYPFHPMMYEPDGKQTTERLWSETLEELRFAGVHDKLSSLSNIRSRE